MGSFVVGGGAMNREASCTLRSLSFVCGLLVAGACAAATPAASPTQAHDTSSDTSSDTTRRPRLVLLITVDQLRPDYFDRWASQLTGGLGRVMRSGAFFRYAVHDHAITATAPGHAAIGSGRFPVHTGIPSNEVSVLDSGVSLVAGVGPGASPADFRGTTLADWMSAADPRTRVLSISYKDRAAILPVGRRVADVYWYSGTGVFTTSTYYTRELPTWVQRFNDQGLATQYAERMWTLLLPESSYPEPDSVGAENGGQDFTFPHTYFDRPMYAPTLLDATPWIDELTLRFALKAVRARQIGRGPQTDFFSLSLSGTDRVGHVYGPDSREIHDQVLRLDRNLGVFLDTLFSLIPERDVVIALTADHGVPSFPEVNGYDRLQGGHRVTLAEEVGRVHSALAARGMNPSAFAFLWGAVLIDWTAFSRAGVSADSVLRAFAADALQNPGVARVDRPSALVRSDTVHDDIARRWLHTYASDTVAPLVVTLKRGSHWSASAAVNHGTPNDYDVTVPLIFMGSQFVTGRIERRVRVVDLAPTLARAIGVRPAERIDGVVLEDAFR